MPAKQDLDTSQSLNQQTGLTGTGICRKAARGYLLVRLYQASALHRFSHHSL